MDERKGINIGVIVWAAVFTVFTGILALLMAIFGDKSKRRDRFIGVAGVVGLFIVIGIIAAATGSSSSSKNQAAAAPTAANTSAATNVSAADPTQAAAAAPTSAPTVVPSPAPIYKLRVSRLSCETDAAAMRICTGTVTNIQPPGKNATDISPVVHWTGGTDSDYGTVDINPLLPGQSPPFTVYTLHSNPQLTNYTIGFKKVFGSESDYPVDPTPAE